MVYLPSTMQFTLIIDQDALRYAFQKKGIHGRLAIWMDFSKEKDFEINLREGRANLVPDFLSRMEGKSLK